MNVPLSGNGTQTGLFSTPSSQAFPLAPDQGVTDVPVGITEPKTIEVTNGGTSTQTVTAVIPPSGEFSASGLPERGTKIAPGQSVTMQVTFAPRQAGPAASSLTIRGNSGMSATVGLSGIGAPPVSQFTPSVRTVKFGPTPVGKKGTATVRLTNTGNQPAIVASSSSLSGPFAIRYRVIKGLPVNGGYDLKLVITFRPTRTERSARHTSSPGPTRKGHTPLPSRCPGRASGRGSSTLIPCRANTPYVTAEG